MTVPTPPAVSEAMREAVARCECGAKIDPNAVFEPGACDPCSARRFNEEAAAHRNPVPPPIPVRGRFYMICCEHCDWVGSSEQCGTDAGQDDSDVYCPVCCQAMLCEEPGEADTAKHGQAVFDRIEAQASEIARLTGDLKATEKKLAAATETFTDDDGTVWSRPTAWAYFASCRALKGLYARAEAAEAETARLRSVLQDCRNTIANPNPGICCTIWFDGITTLQDHIDQALAVNRPPQPEPPLLAALSSQEQADG